MAGDDGNPQDQIEEAGAFHDPAAPDPAGEENTQPQSVAGGDDLPIVSAVAPDVGPQEQPAFEVHQPEIQQPDMNPNPGPAPAAPPSSDMSKEDIARLIAGVVDQKLDALMPELRNVIAKATLEFGQQHQAQPAPGQAQAWPSDQHGYGQQTQQQQPAEQPAATGNQLMDLIHQLPAIASAIVEAKTTWNSGNLLADPLGALKLIAESNPMLLSLYAPSPWGSNTQDMWMMSFKAGLDTKFAGLQQAGEMSKKAKDDLSRHLDEGLPRSGNNGGEQTGGQPARPYKTPDGPPPSSESLVANMFNA